MMKKNINQFGISDNELDHLISILQKNQHVNKITLFGSRAMGNFSNGSDIDIALDGNDLTFQHIVRLSIELDELYLLFNVDLIIYDRINEAKLFEHIRRIGKLFYD